MKGGKHGKGSKQAIFTKRFYDLRRKWKRLHREAKRQQNGAITEDERVRKETE